MRVQCLISLRDVSRFDFTVGGPADSQFIAELRETLGVRQVRIELDNLAAHRRRS